MNVYRSISFNYSGSRMVTTCKDKKLRVIDPRTGAILQQVAVSSSVCCQRHSCRVMVTRV